MKRLLTILGAAIIACAVGVGIAIAASSSTGTNTSCATATATSPAHTIAVDGSDVATIKGGSNTAQKCNTVTYTIPTVTSNPVTQTVTTPAQTVTSSPVTITSPPVTVTQTITQPTQSTTTQTATTTTQTGTTTTSGNTPVPCPLTHAAGADGTNSCWAMNTGVQGSTGSSEAQIEAGAAGFTEASGNVTVSKAGTVIDHEWINGCVAIDANNVTIENSLITPPDGDYCEGGNNGTAPSAINDGNGTTPTGTLVQSVTVDGGNSTGNQFGVSINNGNCILCNVQGFAKNFATGGGTASTPALFEGDYSHDLSTNSCAGYSGGCTTPAGGASSDCAHDNGFYMNSSDYETLQDDYSILTGAGYCTTGAITNLADYGVPSHMTVESSYMEGDTGADLYTGKAGLCGTPDIIIENNAFSNDNGYSGTDLENYWTSTGNTWSGNTIAETGAAFAQPGTDSTC